MRDVVVVILVILSVQLREMDVFIIKEEELVQDYLVFVWNHGIMYLKVGHIYY